MLGEVLYFGVGGVCAVLVALLSVLLGWSDSATKLAGIGLVVVYVPVATPILMSWKDKIRQVPGGQPSPSSDA